MIFSLILKAAVVSSIVTSTAQAQIQVDVPDEALSKELYDEASVSESLGQIDSMKVALRRIVQLPGLRSQITSMAKAKLCAYGEGECANAIPIALSPESFSSSNRQRAVVLSQMLAMISGVKVVEVEGNLIVDGECPTVRDLERVRAVVALYPQPDVASTVRVSQKLNRRIAQAIANDINNPAITARTVASVVILEGLAADSSEKARAETIAAAYAKTLPDHPSVLNLIMERVSGTK